MTHLQVSECTISGEKVGQVGDSALGGQSLSFAHRLKRYLNIVVSAVGSAFVQRSVTRTSLSPESVCVRKYARSSSVSSSTTYSSGLNDRVLFLFLLDTSFLLVIFRTVEICRSEVLPFLVPPSHH